jgi:outer membrane immunogenic protein
MGASMKKLILAAAAIAALSATGPTLAADLAVKARPLPPPPPACAQFGGFYVGGYVGAAYYDHTWNDRDAWTREVDDDLARSNIRTDKSGFIGGLQGGYNWQANCAVFGVQVDYGWSNINASVLETDGDLGAALDTLSVESRLKGLGTVRFRTGIVVDNIMLYVTGGVGWGNFNRTYTQTDIGLPGSETFSTNKTKWAWVAGVGSEWAIWNNWSIQSEVLYARFERDEAVFTCAAAATCTPGGARNVRFEHNDSVWVTKIGLNYRFNYAPVVARY